ncbi:uncharacterized protein LOC129585472 isoform X2 [Paramacrobiotus metropolitanus]|uniref:uncharacterized protein LOC129585472 isoform X2 n=1 Tax=Paramacrobiotus metropolitanus TaxID=2943436 RepID=UPI002445C2F9|nr:uncharacterized protein LOC129585472 isoform X2 [Paramacrobiotus metropolitanus]
MENPASHKRSLRAADLGGSDSETDGAVNAQPSGSQNVKAKTKAQSQSSAFGSNTKEDCAAKIAAGLFFTRPKEKARASFWEFFHVVCDEAGKELPFAQCLGCSKLFQRGEHTGTSGFTHHSSICRPTATPTKITDFFNAKKMSDSKETVTNALIPASVFSARRPLQSSTKSNQLKPQSTPCISYRELIRAVGIDPETNPSSWRKSIDHSAETVVFFQVDLRGTLPRMSKSVRVCREQPSGEDKQGRLIPTVFVDETQLSSDYVKAVIGRRFLSDEDDLMKLLEHVGVLRPDEEAMEGQENDGRDDDWQEDETENVSYLPQSEPKRARFAGRTEFGQRIAASRSHTGTGDHPTVLASTGGHTVVDMNPYYHGSVDNLSTNALGGNPADVMDADTEMSGVAAEDDNQNFPLSEYAQYTAGSSAHEGDEEHPEPGLEDDPDFEEERAHDIELDDGDLAAPAVAREHDSLYQGATFHSYIEFMSALQRYKTDTSTTLTVKRSVPLPALDPDKEVYKFRRVIYHCSHRGGSTGKRKPTTPKLTGCPFTLTVTLYKREHIMRISHMSRHGEHTHPFREAPHQRHNMYKRQRDSGEREKVRALQSSRMPTMVIPPSIRKDTGRGTTSEDV